MKPQIRMILIAIVFSLAGCSNKNSTNPPITGGAKSGTGGAVAMGGAVVTGGTVAAGGAVVNGGAVATGGAVVNGGIVANGGAVVNGGTLAMGGTVATGGSVKTGGAVATGGSVKTGGVVAAGGSGAGGGVTGTGGTTKIPAGLPPVEGRLVSPPATPVSVPDGSVQICKTGDNWVTLVSKNNIGCAKACQSRGMNCRRSYHDKAGACEAQPWELGCGHLAEQGTDFCACSSETFFQGKLYDEHPKTRVAPPIETCQAGEGWATIVFHDKSGCIAACKSVGLKCHSAAEDLELECGPQADPAFKLDCDNTLGHAADFCVCTVDGSAAGLPASVVTPWKPF